MALVEVRNLVKEFDTGGEGKVKAVDGVDLDIEEGQTLGLVGESGCGKSTLGRCITYLLTPDGGEVKFEDVALNRLDRKALRTARRRFQTVFQDPYASLNPRMKVGEIIGEGLSKKEPERKLIEAKSSSGGRNHHGRITSRRRTCSAAPPATSRGPCGSPRRSR